jgi:hypothetical protein
VNVVNVSVLELVHEMGFVLGVKGLYELVEGGVCYPVDTAMVELYSRQVGIQFDDGYIRRVVRKYYSEKSRFVD